MAAALPAAVRWGLRLARAGRPDELRGGDRAASAAIIGELRSSCAPFPDVPVTVLSAGRGFPRRFRARWTRLQAELAATAPQGRHAVIGGAGHNILGDRPDAVADAILQVVAQARPAEA